MDKGRAFIENNEGAICTVYLDGFLEGESGADNAILITNAPMMVEWIMSLTGKSEKQILSILRRKRHERANHPR